MFLSLLIVVIIATTFNACTKGDTGPQGSAGANGYNGNANVNTQTFTISSWSFNSPSYSASVTDYDITQDIVDNGAVMVYVSNETHINDHSMQNAFLFGTGIGLDFVTYYDKIIRIEYSFNKSWEKGIFVSFITAI